MYVTLKLYILIYLHYIIIAIVSQVSIVTKSLIKKTKKQIKVKNVFLYCVS